MPIFLDYLAAATAILLLYLYLRRRTSPHARSLPPGPKPLPLLGNALDMPTSREHETYTQWGKKYGDVVHVNALGKHIIILNSTEAANELLDQRSAIYSDRPYVPMLHEPDLMDSGWSFTFKPYSPSWRQHRRLFAQHLGPVPARAFKGRQLTSTHTLLRCLLHAPTELKAHLKHAAANIILGIAYGYDVQLREDPFVELADRMVREVSQGVSPGGFMVNIFPWLNYLPGWLPGVKFKGFAAKARKSGQDLVELPFESLMKRMIEGTAEPSFVKNALTNMDDPDLNLTQDIKEVAATMYGAASDTTVSSIHSCVLALTLNPEIQRRAHAELDAVLGSPTSASFRLPTYSDRPNLPYIDAILKESLRWLTVLPTAIPHGSTEEDEYRGWRIPKGSIVIANTWSMLHDKDVYPDPFVFRPERFLGDEAQQQPDPASRGAFGFGRRACPGRHLADASLWIEIASLLAAFTFMPPVDANGKKIDISYATVPEPGLLLHPQPFPCLIKPRSKEVEAKIRDTDPGLS